MDLTAPDQGRSLISTIALLALQRRRCSVVNRLTPLLRCMGCGLCAWRYWTSAFAVLLFPNLQTLATMQFKYLHFHISNRSNITPQFAMVARPGCDSNIVTATEDSDCRYSWPYSLRSN